MSSQRVSLCKDWSGGHRLVIIEDAERGKINIASGFVWRTHDEGGIFDPQEGIAAADDLIQAIVDRAWDAGFRPNGISDVKNETAALREHLADMKAIAFHQLKLKQS